MEKLILQIKQEWPNWGAPKIRERLIRRFSFMQYDIGYFDLEACRVEPVDNPFGPKVLSMSPV